MRDSCHLILTPASAVHHTRLHTLSNQLGMLSVASELVFKSVHPNTTHKPHSDKCAEGAISSSETQPNLIIWTSDAKTWRSSGRHRIREYCTHAVDTPPGSSITDRNITDDTRSARHLKFHPHTQSIYNSHLSARAQNGYL